MAQEEIKIVDHQTKKESSVKGTIDSESPEGIKVKVGNEVKLIPAADVKYVQYKLPAEVKGYEAYTFNLILGPAGTPKPVVDTIDQAARKMMADADMVKFLTDIAAVPTLNTSPELTAKFITDEIAKWAPVIRSAGVKIE